MIKVVFESMHLPCMDLTDKEFSCHNSAAVHDAADRTIDTPREHRCLSTTLHICFGLEKIYNLMNVNIVSCISDFVLLMTCILMALCHCQAAIYMTDLWLCTCLCACMSLVCNYAVYAAQEKQCWIYL